MLLEFEPEIEQISLIPSDGGRFEVVVNGNILYSKLQTGRHPRSGEVIELLRNFLKESAR